MKAQFVVLCSVVT